MNLFGRPCKQMIKYTGASVDFSGLDVPIPGLQNIKLAEFGAKTELMQTAAEIAQLLDTAQYANCSQIAMVDDEKEKVRLVDRAIQSQQEIVKFALVMKLATSNPQNQAIQNALATWIAAQAPRINELSAQAENQPAAARGAGEQVSAPRKEELQSKIENLKRAEPQLAEAMTRGAASPDLSRVIDSA
jgi:hypothetical protein